VVAATALGDVVEQRREVGDLGPRQRGMSRDSSGNSWSKRGIASRRRLLTTNSVWASTV
jgi:hypothetical protein